MLEKIVDASRLAFFTERQETVQSYNAEFTQFTLYMAARCWWRSWLRHCATSRKVAGSIPDGVTGFFH